MTSTSKYEPDGLAWSLFAVATTLSATMYVGMAFVLALISQAIVSPNQVSLVWLSVGATAYVAVMGAADWWSDTVRSDLSKRLTKRRRDSGFLRLQSPDPILDTETIANIENQLVNDLDVVERDYYGALLMIAYQGLTLVASLAAIAYLNPQFLVAILGLSALPLVVPYLAGKRLGAAQTAMSESRQRYIQDLQSFLSALFVIRIFGAFARIAARHNDRSANYARAAQSLARRKYGVWSLSLALANLILLGTWLVGAFAARTGHITISEVVALAQLATGVAGPFQIASERFADFHSARTLLRGTGPVPPQDGESFSRTSLAKLEVTLKDVEVVRGDRKILTVPYLSIRSGDRVLITGPSGAGKTTLIALLSGMINPTSGALVFAANGKQVSVEAWQATVALLPQGEILLPGTVAENVSLYSDSTDSRGVSVALERAGIPDLNPEEIVGTVADRVNLVRVLSGGEARRLSLARTIYHQERTVLVLDEPFTGLDGDKRGEIIEALAGLTPDILVVVSHHVEDMRVPYNMYVQVGQTSVTVRSAS